VHQLRGPVKLADRRAWGGEPVATPGDGYAMGLVQGIATEKPATRAAACSVFYVPVRCTSVRSVCVVDGKSELKHGTRSRARPIAVAT